MPTYKEQLLSALHARGWEQVEVDPEGVDWWADEHWRIRSTREGWGTELVLTFLVDPMWDGPRKKGQGIWAIGATQETPRERTDADHGISLCMTKRRFDEKLSEFMAALDDDRRNASPEKAGS